MLLIGVKVEVAGPGQEVRRWERLLTQDTEGYNQLVQPEQGTSKPSGLSPHLT